MFCMKIQLESWAACSHKVQESDQMLHVAYSQYRNYRQDQKPEIELLVCYRQFI